jgi:protein-tyrosine phosphatase
MAEVLLRHHLEQAGVDAAVSSAGLYPGGRPATGHGVQTMAARGLDLTGHASRQLTRDLVAEADLVVGMAREHVREVAVLDGTALGRAFTLKELVRAGEAAGPRRADEPLPAWLDRVAAGRRPADLLGTGHDPRLDVEDPIGRDREDYEATADELDDLLGRLVHLLFARAADGRQAS